MAFNIDKFKSNALSKGGARSSLFEVQITLPPSILSTTSDILDATPLGLKTSQEKLTFLCKATSIPGSSVGVIEIPYMGRKVSCVGSRTFEPWTITVINDEDFNVRKAFEHWLSVMNGHSSNFKNGVTSSPDTYQQTGVVRHFGQRGNLIRVYTLHNLFPTELSSIELSWDNENTIEEFSVTLRYDYWEAG